MTGERFRLETVCRDFGAVEVLKDVSLTIREGEFVAVVGPSGCGKTTLLNILSGFDEATSGRVERSGAIRMVFQQDGLFPWRSAAENIEIGLRDVTDPAERRRQRDEMLALIGLDG